MGVGRIKGITIEIGGDTKPLQNALKGVNTSLKNTQTALKDIDRLLKLDPKNTTLLKQKQDELKNAIKGTEDKLKQEKAALEQLKKADQTPEVVEQQKRLQREIIEDENKLKSLNRELKEFGSVGKQQAIAVGEKFKEVGAKISAVGDSMRNAGMGLTTRLTVPIAGAGAAAIKFGAEFDSQMSAVGAVSGATAEEFDQMRQAAIDWGEKTVYSAKESADALYYMGLAGWSAEESTTALGGVLSLAAAGGLDLGRTSDIVTDSMTALQIAADGYTNGLSNAEHFSNVLAATMSNSNTTVDMLGETFKYAAPVAGTLGYTIEDLSFAAGLMANNGIKASMAGTTLRNIFQRMAKPTEESEAAMRKLGLTMDDGEGNMLSFLEIMDQLREGFSGIMVPEEEFLAQLEELDSALESGTMSQSEYDKTLKTLLEDTYGAEGAQQAMYAAMLGGARGMAGVLAIANATDEEYEELKQAIYGADQAFEGQGAAAGMAATQMDNLKGDVTKLTSALGTSMIGISDISKGPLRDLVQGITEVINKFNALDDAQKGVIVKIALVAAAIGPVLVVLGALVSSVGKIVSGFGSAKIAFAKLGGETGLLKTGLAKLGAAFGTISAPVVAIVAIIGALIAAFVHLWRTNEDFRNSILGTWQRIQETIGGFIDQIMVRLEGFGITFEDITTTLSTAWNAFCELLAPVFEGAFEIIAIKLETVLNVILGVIDVFTGVFTGDWELAWSGVETIFSSIWNGILGILETVLGVIKGVADVFLGWFGTNWETVWNGIKTFFSNTWAAISTTVTTVINTIKTVISTVLNTIMTIFSTAWNAIKTTVSTVINAIRSTISKVMSTIRSTISTVLGAIKSKFSEIWDAIKTKVSTVVESIKSTISSKMEEAKSTITGILDSIKQKFTDVWESAKSTVSSAIEAIKGFLNFKWELPKLKMPHFKVSGSANPIDWLTQGVPHISVEWYKKAYAGAMRFSSPTVLPTANGFKGFGDGNGAEIVVGENSLLSSISRASGGDVVAAKLDALTSLVAEYLPEAADSKIYLDKHTLVGAITPDINRQLGLAYRG